MDFALGQPVRIGRLLKASGDERARWEGQVGVIEDIAARATGLKYSVHLPALEYAVWCKGEELEVLR